MRIQPETLVRINDIVFAITLGVAVDITPILESPTSLDVWVRWIDTYHVRAKAAIRDARTENALTSAAGKIAAAHQAAAEWIVDVPTPSTVQQMVDRLNS